MPEKFYNIYFLTNLISGIGFWLVSFFFSVFIDRIQLNILSDEIPDKKLWLRLNRYNSLFTVISAVFFFCGLGHVVESFRPWANDFGYMIVIHCCTTFTGLILVLLLYHSLYVKK